ncbi:glycosyltransferase [uncultured Dokdonia sp.]|uniref:glycosyltransferase family 2 protein n=1 Tax=uncultured Dokdonia sp. TaxID=575653 RepID=UPI0026016759|nr:glycosyltransferase [uncultured Dokdonia sp.]
MPSYNQAMFLDETLDSVFLQTEKSWECLIIDDGSTDETAAVAHKWVIKDDRFKYFKKDNGGLSSARNYGLKLAQGTYIQLLDSDDLLMPTKFEKQLVNLNNTDICICDYRPFDNETNQDVVHRYLTPFVSPNNLVNSVILNWESKLSIPCHTALFRNDILLDNALNFDESLDNHEDWVFWVKYFYYSQKVSFNREILAEYRIHPYSMTQDYFKMKNGFLQAIRLLEEFFKNNKQPEYARVLLKKRREILRRGREPLLIKYPKRLYRKIISKYKNVKGN